MTDEQINNLMAEFAIENGYCDFDLLKGFLRWLSKTHCIVEKEKIKEWSDKSEFAALDAIDLIEIFDDLFGKELFNGKEDKECLN